MSKNSAAQRQRGHHGANEASKKMRAAREDGVRRERDVPLGSMYLVLTTEQFPDEKLTDMFVQIC